MCFYQFDMNDDLAHNLRIAIINKFKYTVNHNTVVKGQRMEVIESSKYDSFMIHILSGLSIAWIVVLLF